MATIPSLETLLIEIRQSLGLPSHQTRAQQKFVALEQLLPNHREMLEEGLLEIFAALEMDAAAQHDAMLNLMSAEAFQNAVAQETWTRDATAAQVTWTWCAFNYAPLLGRLLANWNLYRAFDSGMPTGKFWFLPSLPNSADGKVSMPLKHVIDWLLDLLGLPMDKAKDLLDRNADGAPDVESIERNLYYWRGGSVFHAETIEKYFPDGLDLDFKGAFREPAGGTDEKTRAALAFLKTKGDLTQEFISEQLVGGCARLLPSIVDGSATEAEMSFFVKAVIDRYSPATPLVIRQRLRVARAVQDGYLRLLKHLCPGVDPFDADPRRNKVLQLIAIVQYIFNLTIAAHQNGSSQALEDQWFESKLAPWDKATIFFGIAPSHHGSGDSARMLARMLNHMFESFRPSDPLPDWMAIGREHIEPAAKAKLELVRSILNEDKLEEALISRLRISSPWRVVSSQSSFPVVRALASRDDLSPRAIDAVLNRLSELGTTTDRQAEAACIELSHLQGLPAKQRPKDMEVRVASLLDACALLPNPTAWDAEIAYRKALHLVSRNEFDAATVCLKSALDLSLQRNSGPLRGLIAWDLLSILVANRRLVPGEHEKPYRHILDCRLRSKLDSFEDTAVEAADYFWDELYAPYPGHAQVKPIGREQAERHIGETFGLIHQGDFAGLNEWLRKNAKDFRKSRLGEVRGNSVLVSWMKLLHGLESNLPKMATLLPTDLEGELNKFRLHLVNMRQAICLLLERWPEQSELADFKGQTPLMLAADHADAQVVRALLDAGANVNAQDYLGRTALHAAITGRCIECLELILQRSPDITLVTLDEDGSAMHTAVKLGHVKALTVLWKAAPTMAEQPNRFGQTPRQLLEALLVNLDDVRRSLTHAGRHVGEAHDYQACLSLLSTPI